jgi:WD40 repeat protein
MACQYWSKELQGIVVWQLIGGAHGFERVAERRAASSGLWTGTVGGLLATTDNGLVRIVGGTEQAVAPLSGDWRLTGIEGRYVASVSPKAGQGQVFRLVGDGGLKQALAPVPATEITLIEGTPRALLRVGDRVSIFNLDSVNLDRGQPLWTVPVEGARAAGMSTDGKKVAAVGAKATYVVDVESGRILSSTPIAMADNSAAATDPSAAKVAYVDKSDKVDVIELASGSTQTVTVDSVATVLLWTRDGKRLLVGDAAGNVYVWDGSGAARLLVATPLAGSFRANAWPGQPAQGTVLQLAVSHDGNRLAVIRQDLPTVDLHDLGDGRRLTQLTAPWTTLKIPTHVSFAPDDAIVTAWAVHPMAKDKPRYVTVHQVPRNFDALLTAATDRLAALEAVWSPVGPSAH